MSAPVRRLTRIQFRRGTAKEWRKANPVLAAGEPGYETDTGKSKIGDGKRKWKRLDYRLDTSDLDERFIKKSTKQTEETQDVTLFRVRPKTDGWGDFKLLVSSYPNVADGSYNHAAFLGWNPDRKHGSEKAGKPAMVIGWEDNFYDTLPNGDRNHGPEFYVEHATPDGSASHFRPIYMRGSNEPGHNRWATHFDIGTDGEGHLDVFAGKFERALFTVNSRRVQSTRDVVITGHNLTITPPDGQSIFRISSVNPTFQLAVNNTTAWTTQALGVNTLAFSDKSSRQHLVLEHGATAATARTTVNSALAVAGPLGFYGAKPVAKPTGVPVTAEGVHAALVTLGLIES